MTQEVECHSGYEFAERPIAMHWQGSRLEVEHIHARWRSPEGKHFKVQTTDGQFFEILYDQFLDEWSIHQP
jgi:hypothetical protein